MEPIGVYVQHAMQILRRIIKRIFLLLFGVISLLVAVFLLYCNSLENVNPVTVGYYTQLKASLKAKGYNDNLLVISSKRAKWHNEVLTLFGASSTSRHLSGEAIDIMVMDVNDDGIMDARDVEVVYTILNSEIVKNKGGLGVYKSEPGIWNRQMVHLDCRDRKARWSR